MILSAKKTINSPNSSSSRSINERRPSASPSIGSICELAGILGRSSGSIEPKLAQMLPNLPLHETAKFFKQAQRLAGNHLSERLLNQEMEIRPRIASKVENLRPQSMQSIPRESAQQRMNTPPLQSILCNDDFAIQKTTGDNRRMLADMRTFGAGQSMNSVPKKKHMIDSKAQNLKIAPIQSNSIQCTRKGRKELKRSFIDILNYIDELKINPESNISLLDSISKKILAIYMGLKLVDSDGGRYPKMLDEIINNFLMLNFNIQEMIRNKPQKSDLTQLDSQSLEHHKIAQIGLQSVLQNPQELDTSENYLKTLSDKFKLILITARCERKLEYIRHSPKNGLVYIIQKILKSNIKDYSDLITLILNISNYPAKSPTQNLIFSDCITRHLKQRKPHFQYRMLTPKSFEHRTCSFSMTAEGCTIFTAERSIDEDLIFSERYRRAQQYVLFVNILFKNFTKFFNYIFKMINTREIKNVFVSIKNSFIFDVKMEADAFKISLSSEPDLKQMIGFIVEYQSNHLDDFGPASVPMARCPEKGFGISYGEIPIDDYGYLTPEGRFLTARIVALWNAFCTYSDMKRSGSICAGKDAEILLDLAAKEFIASGIDPDDPSARLARCAKVKNPPQKYALALDIPHPSESEETKKAMGCGIARGIDSDDTSARRARCPKVQNPPPQHVLTNDIHHSSGSENAMGINEGDNTPVHPFTPSKPDFPKDLKDKNVGAEPSGIGMASISSHSGAFDPKMPQTGKMGRLNVMMKNLLSDESLEYPNDRTKSVLPTKDEDLKEVPKSSLQPYSKMEAARKNKESENPFLSKISHRRESLGNAMHPPFSGVGRSTMHKPSPEEAAHVHYEKILQNFEIKYPIKLRDFIKFLYRLGILLNIRFYDMEFIAIYKNLAASHNTEELNGYLLEPELLDLSAILPRSLSFEFSNLKTPLDHSCIEAFAHISRFILARRSKKFDEMISLIYFYSRLIHSDKSYELMKILLNNSGELLFGAFAEAISAKPDLPFRVHHDKLYLDDIQIESSLFREFYNVLFPVSKSPERRKIPDESFNNAVDILNFFLIIGRAFQNDYAFLQKSPRVTEKMPQWIGWVNDMKFHKIDANKFILSKLKPQ